MRQALLRQMVAPVLAAVFACGAAPDHFSRLQSALTSQGYAIKERTELTPTDWEKAQFDTLKKRSIRVKAIRPIPGHADTYNRFTLIEESYATEDQAKARMSRYQERPPDLTAEESYYGFTLREGFRFKKRVYTLTTDGIIFEPELHRLGRQLRELSDEASRQ